MSVVLEDSAWRNIWPIVWAYGKPCRIRFLIGKASTSASTSFAVRSVACFPAAGEQQACARSQKMKRSSSCLGSKNCPVRKSFGKSWSVWALTTCLRHSTKGSRGGRTNCCNVAIKQSGSTRTVLSRFLEMAAYWRAVASVKALKASPVKEQVWCGATGLSAQW